MTSLYIYIYIYIYVGALCEFQAVIIKLINSYLAIFIFCFRFSFFYDSVIAIRCNFYQMYGNELRVQRLCQYIK